MFDRNKMRSRRLEMGISQSELSEWMETCVANICRIEKGTTKLPRKTTINKIAFFLELEPEDLMMP